MNYTNHYDRLITRAKTRSYVGLTESHHIMPKCAGGSNDKTNLVDLTPEEHYTAHLLLVKIYENNVATYKKLLHACRLMTGNSNIGRKNKLYGWVKRKLRAERLGVALPTEVCNKISDSLRSRYSNISHHLKGKTLSDSHKANCSRSLTGRVFSDKHKQKISAALRGKPKSESHRAQFAGKHNPAYIEIPAVDVDSMVTDYNAGVRVLDMCEKYGYSENKILAVLTERHVDVRHRTCPHCGQIGQTSNMIRWHFDNCKYKRIDSLIYG